MGFMKETMQCNLISKLASQKRQDIVLFNENITPFICKMMDYKQYLYDRFTKEVLETDGKASKLIRKAY